MCNKANCTIEEGRVHLKEHEERIHDLTIENECLSIENLELSAQKDTIKRELMSAQDRLREYAAAENRNEVAILSLQEEIHSKQENIKELIQKKTTLEGQVSRLRDTLASSEFEQRAARETTMRLSGELNREVNARDNAQTEVKETQKELEATKALLERSEASARLLRDRIQTLTEALDKAHSDFDKREAELRRIATLNGSMHTPVHPGSPNDLPVSPRLSKRYEEECNHFQEFLHFGRYYLNKDADAPSGVILKELRSRLVNLEAELGKTKMAFIKCQGDTGEAESAINSRDSRILQLEETVERLRNELAEVSVLNSFLMKVADHLKLDELAAEAEIPLLMDAVFSKKAFPNYKTLFVLLPVYILP
ncbi:unnamed protein product [Schistocephalus solidus]|uniref:Uncharacterized protein n=1 Tax=Schistocephalus solidus TaxID=70667 RepID=A0A183T579_SCHSO|nr:unnamed protein product [Schistocephalus solidus]